MKTLLTSAAALALLVLATESTAFAQTYSFMDPYGNVITSPYSGVNMPSYQGVQQGQLRQDFYGGYNTGPYAGTYGFYRRLPGVNPNGVPYGGTSYPRRFNPYTRI